MEQILITVGTIEPRKGHDHLLDAIESLLARRSDVGFAIVGKRGWLVDDLIARLQGLASRYPQVKWVEGANDRSWPPFTSRPAQRSCRHAPKASACR